MDIEDPGFIGTISDSASRDDLWVKILNAANTKAIAEIGVWKGDFAKAILNQCQSIEKYFMIDPWASLPDWNKPFNVEPRAF